jgi:NADH:ubiquinone oxidoreductase subunit 4 (subunit M)
MIINIMDGCRPDGGPVLKALRRLLGYRVSIGQLIAVAILLGTPYLIVGVIWSSTHTDHLAQMGGIDLVVSYLGAIVSWPVLLVANVCMT